MRFTRVVAVSLGFTALTAAAGVAGQTRPAAPPTRPGAIEATSGDAQRPTGVIRGRIVSADTGLPIIGATVSMVGTAAREVPVAGPAASGTTAISAAPPAARTTPPQPVQTTTIATAPAPPRSALTDQQGYYVFDSVQRGRYTISARKTGHVTTTYGAKRARDRGRFVELLDGERAEKVDIALPRGAVIVATVLDVFGQPAPGARVYALQYIFNSGTRQLFPIGSRFETNDLGQARIFGLAPGEYYVSAAVENGTPASPAKGQTYVTTYYPGTPLPSEAQRVRVESSQEVTLTMPLVLSKTARISGTVLRSDGSPYVGSVTLAYTEPGVSGDEPITLRPDGSFTAANVTPGNYTIVASPGTSVMMGSAAPTQPIELAKVPVTINGDDVAGLGVVARPGAKVSGRFVFDTGAPPPDMRPGSLELMTRAIAIGVDREYGRAVSNPDWTFSIDGVLGTRMIRLRSQVNNWTLKQIRIDGRDITDTPIDFTSATKLEDVEVVVTQKRSDLAGAVTDARNNPVVDYAVVAFPEDPPQWIRQSRFIAAARPAQNGRYLFSLPPGDYLVAAVEYLDPGEESDAEFLAGLKPSAVRLTIREGEGRTLDLKLVERR